MKKYINEKIMIILNKNVKTEKVEDGITRKILAHGGKMMLVEAYFKKGARGWVHSHPHEQISYIQKGSFEFELDGGKQVISVGDTVYIPSAKPHGVLALEDSVIIDIFTPQREDFL